LTDPIHALCIFGTRPDAIKMAPVVLELLRHPNRFRTSVVVTGQHREQLEQVLRAFDLRPDRDLEIMRHGQTLTDITCRVLGGLDAAIAELAPDVVIAQGDTTTTFAASLAAFYRRVPFGHVEAGLRTNDPYDPFPEEMNRRLTGVIARFHFAPTSAARSNLLREGVPDDRIAVTGNTGIDALLTVGAQSYAFADPRLAGIAASPRRLVLITAHRRENWGEPLASICQAVSRLAEEFTDCEFVYAMHRNPVVREIVEPLLSNRDRIHLVEPPDYVPFVKLMQRAELILTDSGGVQEEAPSFGVPVLTLRKTTERPEGVDAGVARLIGTGAEDIVREARRLLSDSAERARMSRCVSPYGDGRAAERIREALENGLKR
jgi:UDP-N-acetylglucosamine 2-epimerase (non-hydrolysing)